MNQKLQELLLVARADPKRAGVLGVLLVVLTVLGVKQFVGAAPSAAVAKSAVDAVHDEILGLSDITALVDSGPTIRVPEPGVQMRDLFRFDDHYFPLPVEDGGDLEISAKSDESKDDPSPDDADRSRREAALVREEAERFRLTSTLLGSQPLAVFEYRIERNESRAYMLRIGEDVRGFTLVSVSHRQAVIEKSGQRFTLQVED